MNAISVSNLAHTWIIDVDGTILKHNGYKIGKDTLLPGVAEFWETIPKNDIIILMSARKSSEKEKTLELINRYGLRYDHAIFNLPIGERLLINDIKTKGLNTAIAINIKRDIGLSKVTLSINNNL